MSRYHRYPCPDVDCSSCEERAETEAHWAREPDPSVVDWETAVAESRYEKEVESWGPMS
jgi:hypothetical protein